MRIFMLKHFWIKVLPVVADVLVSQLWFLVNICWLFWCSVFLGSVKYPIASLCFFLCIQWYHTVQISWLLMIFVLPNCTLRFIIILWNLVLLYLLSMGLFFFVNVFIYLLQLYVKISVVPKTCQQYDHRPQILLLLFFWFHTSVMWNKGIGPRRIESNE